MRLIDADRLLEDMGASCLPIMEKGISGITGDDSTIVDHINSAPTIDAVPVIRCPACSWRTKTGTCRRHGHYVRDDFFCAYGTTGDVRGCRPAKKIEKKAEERCLATGGLCSRCTPGPCDHRRTVIPDDSGQ